MPHGIRGWGLFIVAQAILTFVLHWLGKLAEHAMLTWSDEQIADFLHLSSPEAPTVISWAIPLFLGFITLLAYHLIQSRISHQNIRTGPRRGMLALARTAWIEAETHLALITSPLQIELGNDDKYERTEHIGETGIFRRLIYISVFNDSLDDISDCNVRLIAATPRPKTGDNPTNFPMFFGANFDLRGKQRKFIQIVRFAENPGDGSILERDKIIISAASGVYFPGWTTVPIPSKDNPAILTLEAFAPGITPQTAHLHIWVDQRRLHAKII
jgi:hypothetical protein